MSLLAVQGGATGTGTVTLLAPVTNTDRTLTLPDATGTVLTTATAGVPVNGPAFSAYMGATQTITLSTLTKVIFDVEKFDTNSCFNTSNYRFTPTVSGYYQVNVLVFCDYSVSQFSGAEVHIYKNGASVCRAAVAGVTWYGSQTVADVIYLNGSTDYIEVYGFISGGSGPQFFGNAINRSTFSAAMVRAA